jgi:hypothetical protein
VTVTPVAQGGEVDVNGEIVGLRLLPTPLDTMARLCAAVEHDESPVEGGVEQHLERVLAEVARAKATRLQ